MNNPFTDAALAELLPLLSLLDHPDLQPLSARLAESLQLSLDIRSDAGIDQTLPRSILSAICSHSFPRFRINIPPAPTIAMPSSSQSTDLTLLFNNAPNISLHFTYSGSLQEKLLSRLDGTLSDTGGGTALEVWCTNAQVAASRLATAGNTHETDLSSAALNLVGDPLNGLLSTESAFEPGMRPPSVGVWQRPRDEAKPGITDWYAADAATPEAVFGFVEWKCRDVLSTSDLHAAVIRARVKHRKSADGFHLTLKPKTTSTSASGAKFDIVTETGHSANLKKALLQVWIQHHHYSSRWGALFNTEAAVITHLASKYHVVLSDVIGPGVPDDLSVVGALAAMALGPEAPDGADPSVEWQSLPIVVPSNTRTSTAANRGPLSSSGTGRSSSQTVPLPSSRATRTRHRAQNAATAVDPQDDMMTSSSSPPPETKSLKSPHPLLPIGHTLPSTFTAVDVVKRVMVQQTTHTDHVTTIVLGEVLGRGRIWTAFKATASGISSVSDVQHSTLRLEWASEVWQQQPWKDPSHNVNQTSGVPIAGAKGATPSSSRPSSPTSCMPFDSPDRSSDTTADDSAHVTVKIACPTLFCAPDDTASSQLEGIFAEADIYETHFDLCGTVLPNYGGLFAAQHPHRPATVWVTVLEDVGPPVAEEWQSVNPIHQRYIADLVDRLHASGVAHNDLELHHIRLGRGLASKGDYYSMHRLRTGRGVDSGIRLIDLDQATVDDQADQESEMRLLKRRLGMEGAEL